MDYKKQSSRDNEEKRNANVRCSGCCGNDTRDATAGVFFHVITSLEIRLVGAKYIRRKFYWLWVRQPNKLLRRKTRATRQLVRRRRERGS